MEKVVLISDSSSEGEIDEKTVVPENTNIILNPNNDKLFAELIKPDKFITNTKIISESNSCSSLDSLSGLNASDGLINLNLDNSYEAVYDFHNYQDTSIFNSKSVIEEANALTDEEFVVGINLK